MYVVFNFTPTYVSFRARTIRQKRVYELAAIFIASIINVSILLNKFRKLYFQKKVIIFNHMHVCDLVSDKLEENCEYSMGD